MANKVKAGVVIGKVRDTGELPVISRTVFRDSGADILKVISRDGMERSVGATRNPVLRLRRAESHPDERVRVLPQHVFRFTDAKPTLSELYILVAMGAAVLFESRGRYSVLADRHPAFNAPLVDAHLRRVRIKAKGSIARRTLKEAREVRQAVSCLSAGQRGIESLLDQAVANGLLPKELIGSIKHVIFKRGADAAVVEARPAMEGHLPVY